jgi:polar amino acid transport system substrate-binding protein
LFANSHRLNRLRQLLLAMFALALALAAPGAFAAGCSREIVVPVAPTGFSVIIEGDKVSGVFPDALRELGQRFGCRFSFPVRPRARLSAMFLESGEADLLLPSSRSTQRDQQADYVPMMRLKMALVSLKRKPVQLGSVPALLNARELRGVAVRSYVFGDEYAAMMGQLDQQRRIDYAASNLAVARMLKAGRADFTIVAPSLFLASLQEDAALKGFADEVQFTLLDGLPPAESGVYISRRSLSAQDQATLMQMLQAGARSGTFWKWFQHYYPPHLAGYALRISH